MLPKIKKLIIWVLYNLFIIPFLSFFLFFFKIFNKKAKEREDFDYFSNEFINKLEQFKRKYKIEKPKVIWFHTASMGEFEQAKPVIELLKSENYIEPYFILVSFFSPSGYKNQLNYKYADYITYLPFDTIHKVRTFLKFYKPVLAVFVRYDLWFNYLYYLNIYNIKSILISATISSKIKEKGNNLNSFKIIFYKSLLNNLNSIFTANNNEYNKFKSLNLNSDIINSGDTRIDRIIQTVNDSNLNPIIDKSIFNNKKVIIFGSAWEEEVDLLESLIVNYPKLISKYQFIIAPHEIDKNKIGYITSKIENLEIIIDQNKIKIKSLLFSEFENKLNIINDYTNQIIIIDSIGKLLRLYGIADIAFIGGGFKSGLHSVLEPAGYGLPIICGPKLEKQVDALNLNELGGLFIINDKNNFVDFKNILDTLENSISYNKSSKSNYEYIMQNEGYSKQIYIYITNIINNLK